MTVLKTSGVQQTAYAEGNTSNTSVVLNCMNAPGTLESILCSVDRDTIVAGDVHLQLKDVTNNTVIKNLGPGTVNFGGRQFNFPRGMDLPAGAVYRINLIDNEDPADRIENHLFAA